MSTYSIAGTAQQAYPAQVAGPYEVTATLDFTTINSGSGTVQNDIVQLIQVPANTFVMGVSFSVTTASSNMTDFDIGDGTTADGYIDGASMASVNDGASFAPLLTAGSPSTFANGTEPYANGLYYTAADTIDLKQNTNATVITGVLKVKAVMIDMNCY